MVGGEVLISLGLAALTLWWFVIYDRDPRRSFTILDSVLYFGRMAKSAFDSVPLFWLLAFFLVFLIVES